MREYQSEWKRKRKMRKESDEKEVKREQEKKIGWMNNREIK